jgi:hypothetical protein
LARGKALWKVGPHTTLVEHVVGPQEIELVDTDARMLATNTEPGRSQPAQTRTDSDRNTTVRTVGLHHAA